MATTATFVPLSVVEKYLIRKGFEVRDVFVQPLGRLISRASHAGTGQEIDYPHPKIVYDNEDWPGLARGVLADLAGLLDRDEAELARDMWDALGEVPEGYACRACGQCCSLRDAYQSTLSPDEVAMWREAGREDILRLVVEAESCGGRTFKAWVNPKTGRYLKKCPWLVKGPGTGPGSGGGQGRVCAIHDVKPYKCRAFPLFPRQAERIRCPGLSSGLASEEASGSLDTTAPMPQHPE